METLSFFVQTNLFLVIFFGCYWLLFRTETFHTLNRIYLLTSVLFSFLLPFLQSEWLKNWLMTETVAQATTYTTVLSELIISPSINNEITYFDVLKNIYYIGVALFSLRFGYRCWHVYKLLKTPSFLNKNAFSFFSKIWIDETLDNQESIYAHESVHKKEFHSFDVLFFELLEIIFWFNPIIFFYKKAIQLLHEFIADEYAATTLPSKTDYALLLLSQLFSVAPTHFVQPFFNKSTLKTRIKMLLKKRSNQVAVLKYGIITPAFVGMMFVASIATAHSPQLKKVIEVADLPLLPSVHSIEVQAPKVNEIKELPITKSDTSTIIEVADELPEFVGGTTELYKFIGENIKYPAQAQKAKVEGKVFVKFVVEKDGSTSNFSILKGIGSGCDEETIRVVKKMPAWKPGKHKGEIVRTYLIFPVQFVLGNTSNEKN